MELKLGKMSSKELAEWFGISYTTYRRNPKKYLEKLHKYADYNTVYGGVEITCIHMSKYSKHCEAAENDLYLDEIKNCNDGLSTLSGMSNKLIRDHEEYKDMSDRAVIRRLSFSRNFLFGNPRVDFDKGSAGTCEYKWAVKLDNYNSFRQLTAEEEELFNQIIANVYGEAPDKVKEEALLLDIFLNTDMSKEEYQRQREYIGKRGLFAECLDRFYMETGYRIVRATKHSLFKK